MKHWGQFLVRAHFCQEEQTHQISFTKTHTYRAHTRPQGQIENFAKLMPLLPAQNFIKSFHEYLDSALGIYDFKNSKSL